MPVYKLMQEMPYEELLMWGDYLSRRPIDWRADDRAYKILQTQGVKHKPGEIFSSLNAIYNTRTVEKEGGLGGNFKQSFMFQKIALARGGDKIPL